MADPEELFAGMGEFVIGHAPCLLVALGLGSCIGCAIYDPEKKIGGLAHIMLPTSKEVVNQNVSMDKFADIAIPKMYEQLKAKGCAPERMTAKIAGGAHMFQGIVDSAALDIGKRNDAAVRDQLKILGVKLVASETGGNVGRTVRFDTENGKMMIKSKDEKKDI